MPVSFALDSSDVPESNVTEAADDSAASAEDKADTPEESGLSGEEADADKGAEISDETESAPVSDDAQAEEPEEELELMALESSGVSTADDIENGTITLTEDGDKYTGTAVPDNGYDLATVRQLWTDSEGNEHEQYLDYKKCILLRSQKMGWCCRHNMVRSGRNTV